VTRAAPRASVTDSSETPTMRALRFALLGFAAGAAAALGLAGPVWLVGGQHFGGGALLFVLATFSLAGLAGGFLVGLAREGLGALFDGSLQSGRRGRPVREYSEAQSLVIRGEYRQAVEFYAAEAVANPKDPEPLILAARVLRDHLHDPAAAAEWLVRARHVDGITPRHDITIVRELVDLYDGPLDDPWRALPELARIAATYPNTSAATWARNTLSRLRVAVWTDLHDGTDDDR
jgi:hypothetical protein